MTGRHATITVGYLARNEEIGRRAYEIHLEREQPGREPDDWLQAERELEGGVLSHVQAGWEADRQHSW